MLLLTQKCYTAAFSILLGMYSVTAASVLPSATHPVDPPAAGRPAEAVLENDLYRIRLLKDASLQLTVKERSAGNKSSVENKNSTQFIFRPDFMVIYRANDPGLRRVHKREIAFQVPGWKKPGKEDEFTTDLFRSGEQTAFSASEAVAEGNRIVWSFPAAATCSFRAELTLPSGREAPRIRYLLTARKAGWYSAGYTGAPETRPSELNELWQPLIWQERRFPSESFLSAEYMCSLPAVLVNRDGYTLGVAADPSEIPFRFQFLDNSRFGIALRDKEGNARPMIFAPVLGQERSALQPGDTVGFCLRLIARPGALFGTYRSIAESVYGFHDYRKNTSCSLNETLENMIGYAMNDVFSGWEAELKAPDYSTDVKGTVKLVSALHPLSLAMITGNRQIYTRRALPMIEYLMSREKYLFSIDTSARHQSPSHYLKGPAAEVSELAALYSMSGERSTVFRHYAEDLYGKPRVLNLNMVSEGASWQSSLALYRMNGRKEYLNAACEGADNYIAERIETPQTDFSDVHIESGGQFWTDFAPKWIDLLELYEETGEDRYLEAAARGAELFVAYVWMQPTPPDSMILINEGGKAGTYAHQNRNNPDVRPMEAPEQLVPAWKVAQTGLMSEASTTYSGNRAVFLAHHAAYLLRLARYTGNDFFSDIARSAIVGRYANFPGYSIMGEYTTIYARPDYPLKPLNEITYNNIYYNHIWPHIALLADYLVSDAFRLSGGKIDFPPRYAQGYAYLQSKVYGDRPGRFYDDEGVQLWMPRQLLRTDNIQGNYLAGYGNGNLYIAVMNQAPEEMQITIRLNPDLVPYREGETYKVRLWRDNQPVDETTMKNGEITVPVSGSGISAFAVEGLTAGPGFGFGSGGKDAGQGGLPEESYSISDTPLGAVTGMIISMGPELISSYVWLQATEKELKAARLHYRAVGTEGEWKVVADGQYPYEFSIPLSDKDKAFEYRVEGLTPAGNRLETETVKLELK